MTGKPFGRIKPTGAVGVAPVAGVGEADPPDGGVSLGGGGTVGPAGVGVSVGAKIAVSVRFGVGKVNGVGEAAPGNVHAAAARTNKRRGRYRLCGPIFASDPGKHTGADSGPRWGGWELNPHEVALRGF